MKKRLLLLVLCLSLLGSVRAQSRLEAFANIAVLSAGARGLEYTTSAGKQRIVRQAFTDRIVSLTVKPDSVGEATMECTAIPWRKIPNFTVRRDILEPQLSTVVIEFSEAFPYQLLVGTKKHSISKEDKIEMFVLTADASKMRKYLAILQNAR